ncbi:unnamed protein product [Allacma fusca]|uniref:HEAT repeat-containing protein 1 n=1 Tax=Allacma fusca TaxID=39272 RepID=A0A8J2PN11_9HEXA|nr:unnamed protein product [Allacma fusca]
MSTSLQRQLIALSVPSSSLLDVDRKRASIIFTADEASKYDRETFYQIGLEGLKELYEINQGLFSGYFDSVIFNEAAKSLERAVQDKDTNERLDKVINEFLVAISPYMMIKAPLKCMEWLVYRFHIERFNVDAILECILPFYDTKTFALVIKVFEGQKFQTNPEWLWLVPSIQTGLPVPKATLFANRNVKFITWIFDALTKFLVVHEAQPENLSTFLAFLTSTLLENENLHSSLYMILTMLVIIRKETPETSPKIPATSMMNLVIRTYPPTLEKHAILLLNLVGSAGYFELLSFKKEPELRDRIIQAIAVLSDEMDVYFAAKLVLKSLMIRSDRPSLAKFWEWIGIINLSPHQRAELLKELFFSINNQHQKNKKRICDRLLSGEFALECERKYPVEFTLASETDAAFSEALISAHKKLGRPHDEHAVANFRVQAVNKVLSKAQATLAAWESNKQMNKKNPPKAFLKDTNKFARTLIMRFHDDDKEVVLVLLQAKVSLFKQIFSYGMLIKGYSYIVKKHIHPKCTRLALKKLCRVGELLDPAQKDLKKEVMTVCIPFLLPLDLKSLKLAKVVLRTNFAQKNDIFKKFGPAIQNTELSHKDLCKLSYELLTSEQPELDSHHWIQEFGKENTNFTLALLALVTLRDGDGANIIITNVEKLPLGSYGPYPVKPEHIFKQLKDTLKNRTLSLELLFTRLVKIEMDKELVQKVFTFALLRSEKPEFREICASFMKDLLQKSFTRSSALLDFWMCMILATRSKIQDPQKSEYLLIRSLQFLASVFEKLAATAVSKETGPAAKLIVEEPTVASSPARNTRSSMRGSSVEPLALPLAPRNTRLSRVDSTDSDKSVKDKSEEYKKESSDLVELLLTHCVQHDSTLVRRWGLQCIKIMLQWRHLEPVWRELINYVLKFRAAIQSDKTQLSVAVSKLLNEKDSLKVQDRFLEIVTDENKCEVIREGFVSLCAGASFNVFEKLIPHIQRLLKKDPSDKFLKLYVKTYDGSMKYIEVVEECLNYSQTTKPILKKLTSGLFEVLDLASKKKLFSVMINASVRCQTADVKVSIQRTVRKWLLDTTIINAELENCLVIQRRQVIGSSLVSGRRSIGSTQFLPADTNVDWVARTEAVLEFAQSGKRLKRKTKLIQPLFKILKICITMEEQTPVEYLKQLMLTSLTVACEDEEIENIQSNMNDWVHFQVDSVIDCLRCSRNPQTHHHALILLNYAAKRFPEQVLHGVMSLFTFMGSSILRQDDAYSTQLIQQTVVSIIPTLAKSAGAQQFQRSLVSAGIYRVFTSAVQDIPVHRRVPIFKSLVEVMDPVESMWQVCFIIVDEALMGANKRNVLKADLELAKNILWSFDAPILLKTLEKMYMFLSELPIYDKNRNSDFSKCKTAQSTWSKSVIDLSRKLSLRDAQLVINFTLELIAKTLFESLEAKTLDLEPLLEKCLSFSRLLSPLSEDKVFRLIANRNFEVIDKVNAALEPKDFVQVVKLILEKDDNSIKKRILDIFNQRIIQKVEWFGDIYILLELLPCLLAFGNLLSIDQEDTVPLIQTAFLSLKLLSRHLALKSPEEFIPVFELSYRHARHDNKLLASSALLCLSELFCLKSLILPQLNDISKSIQRAFKRSAEDAESSAEELDDHLRKETELSSNLLLVSGMTALNKFVDNLGTFVGTSFLTKSLVSVLSINSKLWGEGEKADNRRKTFDLKLKTLVKTISAKIPLRNSLNSLKKAFGKLIGNSEALSLVLRILRDSIVQAERADFNTLLPALFDTFLNEFLIYRSRVKEEELEVEGSIEGVEDAVIECLVSGIVLKLSETAFRPFYHRLYDWAGENLARKITFYRLSGYAAERLKSLFVTFAGYVIGDAADSLNENLELTKAILHYLYHIFLNDREGFVTTDRFNTLVQPLVDLIESEVVVTNEIPIKDVNATIVQLAVATNDVNRWHHLMDLLVIKADHEDCRVRLYTIALFEAVANELEKDFLELLPPTVQALSNLLGDDHESVQKETRKMLIKLEAIVGEPLQPYFSS